MTDRELGLKVFTSFWDWNRMFYPGIFKLSLNEFLSLYGSKIDTYLDGVGGGVRSAKISDSRIDEAMRALALSSQGKIPSRWMDYFNYLSNEAVKVNYLDAASFVLVESVGDVIDGAAKIGDSIITTGKILTYLFPVIALIVIYFLLNQKTDGQFSKAVKGLRK